MCTFYVGSYRRWRDGLARMYSEDVIPALGEGQLLRFPHDKNHVMGAAMPCLSYEVEVGRHFQR